MTVAARSWMAAGVAAISATAIVAAPALRPLPEEVTAGEVRLAAAQTVTPELRALVSAAQQLVAPQNAATNAVDYAYSVITYWTDYGVELADYALQFVPFGGLISSQIDIVYPQVIGVTDSLVYDLIDPVLENPLDLSAYIDGLIDVAVSTVTALVNVAVGEVDYFFGWLIPPLPGPQPFTAPADVRIEADAPDQEAEEADEEDEEVDAADDEEVEAGSEVDAEPEPEPEPEAEPQPEGDVETVEDLADLVGDDSGAQPATPEQPGGRGDAEGGEDEDAVGHDVTPTEDDVPAGTTEGQDDEGGQPGPQGESGEAA
ncbi:hypothetical protein NIIDNTM18_38920 [Mycolicibacterium litorale]|uniref:PE-PGRS family protein n=1 Tax=Mycolicibacterium litorale TaxID=758802 RepID=A0A6S6P7M1_9MYCO|nr:hypothetical protein NIIDNTM18_38920 [Mycolicibacterium litorale]